MANQWHHLKEGILVNQLEDRDPGVCINHRDGLINDLDNQLYRRDFWCRQTVFQHRLHWPPVVNPRHDQDRGCSQGPDKGSKRRLGNRQDPTPFLDLHDQISGPQHVDDS